MLNPSEARDNMTLSTIMRFHNRERLSLLEEAISSLATQDWKDFEVVVMLQNPDETLAQEVVQHIRRQPWSATSRSQVIPVEVPAGVDGRAELLSQGLKRATGRFVAFLDDDDIVYAHGYAMLIRQLLTGGGPVAVGGYRKAYLVFDEGRWRVRAREESLVPVPSRLTLFRYNYIPLHSYVIDRSRLGDFELCFDSEVVPLEDYDFLLRLFAVFEPDFACFDTPVCEYRVHELNTMGHALDRPEQLSPPLRRALDRIAEKKKTLSSAITVDELSALTGELARLSGERERLLYRLAGQAHAALDRLPRFKASLRNARELLKKSGARFDKS